MYHRKCTSRIAGDATFLFKMEAPDFKLQKLRNSPSLWATAEGIAGSLPTRTWFRDNESLSNIFDEALPMTKVRPQP